jgi:hypothetical protein
MLPFTETSSNSTGVYSKILKLGLTVAAGGCRYTHAAFLGGGLGKIKNKIAPFPTSYPHIFQNENPVYTIHPSEVIKNPILPLSPLPGLYVTVGDRLP